jgi:hypothetical protein
MNPREGMGSHRWRWTSAGLWLHWNTFLAHKKEENCLFYNVLPVERQSSLFPSWLLYSCFRCCWQFRIETSPDTKSESLEMLIILSVYTKQTSIHRRDYWRGVLKRNRWTDVNMWLKATTDLIRFGCSQFLIPVAHDDDYDEDEWGIPSKW